MSRRSSPEALFIARRIATLRALEADGMPLDMAERWLGAWEAEARVRGLDAREPGFWQPSREWIREQRRGARDHAG